ncbi:MAG: hypothetical protein U1F37_02240 [Alphaproteobacteria bacterium]
MLAAVADFAGEESFAELLGALLARPERLRAALEGGFAAFERRLYAALGLSPDDTEARIVAAAAPYAAMEETAHRRRGDAHEPAARPTWRTAKPSMDGFRAMRARVRQALPTISASISRRPASKSAASISSFGRER